MPKKCESCRFYGSAMIGETCVRLELPEVLNEAREICDREGDGIFVYFEPKEPTAGAVATPDFGIPNTRGIDRSRPQTMEAAA